MVASARLRQAASSVEHVRRAELDTAMLEMLPFALVLSEATQAQGTAACGALPTATVVDVKAASADPQHEDGHTDSHSQLQTACNN